MMPAWVQMRHRSVDDSPAAQADLARVSRAAHKVKRRQRRTLERELAAYSSPADRLEVEAIVSRYPAEQTTELREILNRQWVSAA